MGNSNLVRSRVEKNDEYYTLYEDIVSEMEHYKHHFKGKVVYMNCDDPRFSNFWKYFKKNFQELGLKKIISTYYALYEPSYRTEYDGKEETKTRLRQNGNFLSVESEYTLKEADIVVSNPPFSLYRRYISQLLRHDKDFLIVGNYGSLIYQEVFPSIKEGTVRVGQSPRDMDFITPEGEIKSVNACWFTNLEVKENTKRKLNLTKSYYGSEEDYPIYENTKYDVINVDTIADIPKDYEGLMGVPITIFDYDYSDYYIMGRMSKNYNPKRHDYGTPMVNGEIKFVRVVIQKK